MLNTTVVDIRFVDGGGEVVGLTRWFPFTPRKIAGTHFCQSLGESQGHSAMEEVGQSKNPMTSSGI